ncbi:hypothetical protein WA026_013268 [Henosepilachna vigintioctopunctata]|uniref:Ribosomal protein L4 n=1 Tax=Henosepilachna vigintioctopunctata TaxID=420089 RepID=A0AAW1UIJ6_9CUCU
MLKPNDIAELFGRAYLKWTTGQITIKGFCATGISPYNLQVFSNVDFITEATNNNQSCVDNQSSNVGAAQNIPGTSTALQETPTALILPEDILPLPGANTRISNRGREATKAKLITSSLYKNRLTESLRLAHTRGQGRIGRRSRGPGHGRSQGGLSQLRFRGVLERDRMKPVRKLVPISKKNRELAEYASELDLQLQKVGCIMGDGIMGDGFPVHLKLSWPFGIDIKHCTPILIRPKKTRAGQQPNDQCTMS